MRDARVGISRQLSFPDLPEKLVALSSFFGALAAHEPLLKASGLEWETVDGRAVWRWLRNAEPTDATNPRVKGHQLPGMVVEEIAPATAQRLERILDLFRTIAGRFDEFQFYAIEVGGDRRPVPIESSSGLTTSTRDFWYVVRTGAWHHGGKVFEVYLRVTDAIVLRRHFMGFEGGRPPETWRLVLDRVAADLASDTDFDGAITALIAGGCMVTVTEGKPWKRSVTVDAAQISEKSFRYAVKEARKRTRREALGS